MQSSMKLLIASGGIFGISIFMGLLGFDQILRFAIRDQTALRKRNDVYSIYLKIPFPLDFRVYFFNVSNPMEVQQGAKPILTQVGPFCYDEFVEKHDVYENDGDDSLTYRPYALFKFNKDKSGELSDEDYVTILHPLIVGMVNTVASATPALLSIVNKALNPIFEAPKSIYVKAKVKDILFDGFRINCDVPDFSSKAVCTQLKQQIPGIKISETEKNIYFFSLLGPRNATDGKPYKVLRGIKNSKDLGKLIEFDSKKESGIWSGKTCNSFQGTDGWIFPPLTEGEAPLWTYSPDLCRSVKAYYVEPVVYKGINVRKYHADLGDIANNPEEKCFCLKTCPRKGLFDLSKCMGVPIIASLPHFLHGDESLMNEVVGMSPDVEAHIIRLHFEPLTSSPLEAKKRMQFNMQIEPVQKVALMKTLPEVLHPIFWIEESIELEGPLFKKISTIMLLVKLMGAAKWGGIILCGLGVGLAAYLHFRNRKSFTVTPVQSVAPEKEIKKNNNEVNERGNNHSGYVNHAMSDNEPDKY